MKRQRIQKLVKRKPKTAKRLPERYSKRGRNRARDSMYKLMTQIARGLKGKNCRAIPEDQKYQGAEAQRLQKEEDREVECPELSRALEYKPKCFGSDVKYIDPRDASPTCLSVQAARLPMGRLVRCGKCEAVMTAAS